MRAVAGGDRSGAKSESTRPAKPGTLESAISRSSLFTTLQVVETCASNLIDCMIDWTTRRESLKRTALSSGIRGIESQRPLMSLAKNRNLKDRNGRSLEKAGPLESGCPRVANGSRSGVIEGMAKEQGQRGLRTGWR